MASSRYRMYRTCRPERVEPELLLDGAGEEAAHTVRLPIRRQHDVCDTGALRATEQRENQFLLSRTKRGHRCARSFRWNVLGRTGRSPLLTA